MRTICFAFPEVTERLSRGERVWFVRSRKLFVTCADHHHDDRRGLWCVAPEGARGVLGISQPERCFVPPYVGHRGWLGGYLVVTSIDWAAVGDIVEDGYRTVAPRSLVARLED